MATYDSAKTRCAAQAIAQLASGMHSAVEPGMRAARERMDLLQGRTARAREEALDRLWREEQALHGEMEALAHQVAAYASQLEQLDEKLARRL